MKVFLEMNRGLEAGRRFELSPNVYRAIGRREEDSGQTMTLSDESPLGPDEHAVVDAHLQRRKKRTQRSNPVYSPSSFRRGADILIEDQLISRTHAMVFFDDQGPSLVDLGSTNGTFVNAQAVTDAELFDGDVIHIGRAQMIVCIEEGAV